MAREKLELILKKIGPKLGKSGAAKVKNIATVLKAAGVKYTDDKIRKEQPRKAFEQIYHPGNISNAVNEKLKKYESKLQELYNEETEYEAKLRGLKDQIRRAEIDVESTKKLDQKAKDLDEVLSALLKNK